MMKWFNENELLHGTAFVMIGDDPLDSEFKFKNAGCVLPRLLGITEAGTLVGISASVLVWP